MAEPKGQEIKTPEAFTISKDALKELLLEVMTSARKMTPLEERKYQEEVETERRRNAMMVEMAKAEEEGLKRKRTGCSHKRDKSTGENVPRSDPYGVWITQGQLHSNDVISLICLRCSTVWQWKADTSLRQYAQDSEHGLLGFPPPVDGAPGVTIS